MKAIASWIPTTLEDLKGIYRLSTTVVYGYQSPIYSDKMRTLSRVAFTPLSRRVVESRESCSKEAEAHTDNLSQHSNESISRTTTMNEKHLSSRLSPEV